MASKEVDIGAVGDFPEGRPHRVEVAGRPLAIVRREKNFFALRDMCPHQGAPLSAGHIGGIIRSGQPGEEITYARSGEILTCPWHGWEFDVCTGRSLVEPERARVRTYPVRAIKGRLRVRIE